jgi:uncharacterized protein (TIGR00288 family)
MKNIAIFYDVENLIGGYDLKFLEDFSIKSIFAEINRFTEQTKKDFVKNISLQKGYADWSNYKISKLKWDIAEVGIEPIQMYGFAKGAIKNSSDIQLVVDAMEVLYTKPFIDTFIIVSGDGGFLSLARKLNEHGKKVIGSAYRSSTNSMFRNLCDEFIYLEEPQQVIQMQIEQQKTEKIKIDINSNLRIQIAQNPILKNFSHKINQIDSNSSRESVFEQIRKVLEVLKDNNDSRTYLNKDGLNISILKTALMYAIKDFDYLKYGFGKFVDFIRFAVNGSGIKLVLKEPSEYRLVMNEIFMPDFYDVELITEPSRIHSIENYKVVLANKKPVIKIPENIDPLVDIFETIVSIKEQIKFIQFEEIINILLNNGYEQTLVRESLYLLINSGVLAGDNSSIVLAEQKYNLVGESIDDFFNQIKNSMVDKLNNLLREKVDEKIVDQILQVVFVDE